MRAQKAAGNFDSTRISLRSDMFWLIEVTIPGGLAGAIHGGFNFANFGDSEAGVELEAYEVRLLASDLGRDTLGS